MKGALAMLGLVIAAFLLQTAFFPKLFLVAAEITGLRFLAGHTINLTLIMLVYLALNRDTSGTLIWSLVFGIVGGAFGTAWNGALPIGLFSAALVCSVLRRQILLKDPLSMGLFVGTMLLLEGISHRVAGNYLNPVTAPFRTGAGFLLLAVLLSSLAAPLVFLALRSVDEVLGVFAQRGRRNLLIDL